MPGSRRRPTKAATARGNSVSRRLAIMSLAVILVPFSLPTIALLLFGMLPTLVAAIVDRSPSRYAWLSVGGTNLAGAAPYLFQLWFGDHSLQHAFTLLTDVFVVLVMYGAASVGWLLFMAAPPVVGTFLMLTSERRVAALRHAQQRIVEEWGEEVTAGADQE